MASLWALLTAATSDAAPALDALGLQTKQFFILSCVDFCPSPSTLARATQSPPATVTSVLKVLEDRGYVVRATVPGDLRRFDIRLTDQGRAALEKGERAMDEAFGKRLAVLSPEQQQQLQTIIAQMLQGKQGNSRNAQ